MRVIRNDERGAALVATLLLAVVVSALGMTSAALVVHSSEQSATMRDRVAAVHAAEAGIDWAVQQMSATTGSTCSFVATPVQLPGSTAPGAVQYAVTVTDSNPVGGCGDDANDLRRLIETTGVDGRGIERRMLAEVQLEPVYSTGSGEYSFNDAILAGRHDHFDISSSIRLTGDGSGDNADVYTAYTGTATLGGAADIRGDIVARGAVTIGGSAQVRQDVWANGNVIVNGSGRVWGNVLARGNVTILESGRVNGWVRATGTITVPGTWATFIDGTKTPNDPTVPVPPDRTLPTPPSSFNGNGWPLPYKEMTCAQFNDAHNGFWPEEPTLTNRNNFVGTYRITGGNCVVVPGGDSQTLTLKGDAAIVTNGCIEMKGSAKFARPSGTSWDLTLVSLKGVDDFTQCSAAGTTGAASASGDNWGIKLAGGAAIKDVPTMLISTNRVHVAGSVTIWGQIAANRVKLEGGFGLTFRKLDAPGFTTTSGVTLNGYKPKVLYVRQVN